MYSRRQKRPEKSELFCCRETDSNYGVRERRRAAPRLTNEVGAESPGGQDGAFLSASVAGRVGLRIPGGWPGPDGNRILRHLHHRDC